MKRLLIAQAALAVLLTCSCAPVENEEAPGAIASLSEDAFRCKVEPILIRDCSYPACHGKTDMPLRVYSVGKLRAGDMETMDARNAPLTESERHANYESALGFTYGGVGADDNMLLRKVLPVEVGGYEHAGGALFGGTDDVRAAALRAWLGGDGDCGGIL